MKKLIIILATIMALGILGSCGGSSDKVNSNEPQVWTPTEMQNISDETLQSGTDIGEEAEPEVTYVLNTNSMKFHKPSCRSVELMKPENYQETSSSREEVLEMGYSPCGNCIP